MPGEAETSDVTLLAQTAAGDRDAFDQLVRRHQASLYRLIRLLCADASLAEDALQETFLSAFRAAHTYHGPAPVGAWLRAIARHAAVHQARRRRPVPVQDHTLEQLGAEAGWGSSDAAEIADRARSRVRVERALASLHAEDRAILVLRDVDGLSGEATAQVLGLTLAAEKSRLLRARLRLTAALRSQA